MSFNRIIAVLRELRDTGPATATELAAATDFHYDGVWYVIRALNKGGLIVPKGFGTNRNGGHVPIVWALAPTDHPRTDKHKTP